jgi:methylmalonyl-CoA/ethylmalonyl-CoA epimerase
MKLTLRLLNTDEFSELPAAAEGIEVESKVELLGAMHEESAIYKYLQKRGQGIHHVAVEVDDIHAEMERLRAAGFELINEEPKEGADNKLICFVHPRSTGGVLLELCQEKHPAQ